MTRLRSWEAHCGVPTCRTTSVLTSIPGGLPETMKTVLTALVTLLVLASPVSLAEESYFVAVIGTGDMGSALGVQLAAAGHTVTYGSRDPSRPSVQELVETTGASATAATQREAADRSEIIILAVPWFAVESLIPELGDLSGKILVDITTGSQQGSDGYPELAVETSTSEQIQAWAPDARVVKTAFASATTVRDPHRYGEPVMTYIAADDREAKEIVAGLAIQLELFPLDAGPLRMSRTIDHLGILYLTPMIQGRNHTWETLPRMDMDLSCVSTEGWFEPVEDDENLARFPNLEAVDRQCAD